jgi:hypothetical protein
MTKTRIAILDTIAQEGLDLLEAAKTAGVEYEVRTGLKGDSLKKTLQEFDGAICRSGVTIGADVLEGTSGCGRLPGRVWARTTSIRKPRRDWASW